MVYASSDDRKGMEVTKNFFGLQLVSDLANPTWFPLQTNTLSGDSFYFSDPQWTNYPARFYHRRSP